MPFSFPSSPTVGQTSTQNGRVYRYAGNNVWELAVSAGGTSWVAAPSSPTATGTAGSIAYDGRNFYVATAANTWRRVALSSWEIDAYFTSVSLLLHVDGANGSTAFEDFSGTPKTITAVGGAAISTAQSKFGGASFAATSGKYLTTPVAAGSFAGDDFAIEAWVYPMGYTFFNCLISAYTDYSNSQAWGLFAGMASNNNKWYFASGGVYPPTVVSSSNISLNAWTHIAVARSGNTLRLFVNGTAESTADVTGRTFNGHGSTLWIGAAGDDPSNTPLNGYIDDLRITKGSARGYTGSSITVPTAAFLDQ